MKTKNHILAATAVLAGFHAASGADIAGKIILKGTPPPEKEITQLKGDVNCGKLHTDTPKTRFFVVGPGGELADVMVYIKSGLTGKTFDPPSQPATLDQVGCEYTPYVMGIKAKQKLMVSNSDPVMHNVHTQPMAPGNKEMNKAQMAKMPALPFTFDNPEVFVKFKCDVHPWMFAYVGVLEHPYFAVTGKDGGFKLANVPPGKYVIEAVHRKAHGAAGKGVTKEITVGSDNVVADFTIELPKAE